MTINHVQYDWLTNRSKTFGLTTHVTLAMGEAFDHACMSLRSHSAIQSQCVETIAKRFIEAAKNGERDPARLHEQALKAFRIEEIVDASC